MKTRPIYILLAVLFLFSYCSEDSDESSLNNYDQNERYLPYDDNSVPENFPDETSGETYNEIVENKFVEVSEQAVSTFSIDADGGSYANMRRYLTDYGQIPPKDAIRVEEFINYFNYQYDDPTDEHPVKLNGEVSICPWSAGHKLIRIGIKGKTIKKENYPASNIVLLIDVSGSMSSSDKLGILQQSFKLMVDELTENDKIAIVTYAGSDKIVLDATSGNQKQLIKSKIDELSSGGGTAGAQGIITAYEIAERNYIEGGNNRIIVGSDGDFNIGPSSQEEIVKLIESKRERGVFLTTVGVGTGNFNDAMMEQLANNGNGTYEYIDNLEQAQKVFVEEFNKFFTVAKDCKVQVEFEPTMVKQYRLIGYENRMLNQEDFTDDKKDAGEIGSGQCITALYEIVPTSTTSEKVLPAFTIDFRYKQPTEDVSKPMQLEIYDTNTDFESASESMRFAASVAGLGLVMRDSEYKGTLTYENIQNWANNAKSYDPYGFKTEFVRLVGSIKSLQ